MTLNAPAPSVLVSGFAPFGGERINPSWEIARALPPQIAGWPVRVLRVPTVFDTAVGCVTRAVDKWKPSLVVCLGQAGGRTRIGVERVAINVDDAPAADNAGRIPVDELIAEDGPVAYWSTLPIKSMVAAMRKRGVPAEVSNSAGTFVCNHLMYGLLHHIHQRGLPVHAGFVHVPWTEKQTVARANAPALSLPTMINGIEAAIVAAIASRTRTRRQAGGRTPRLGTIH